jgi:hypothetical protein
MIFFVSDDEEEENPFTWLHKRRKAADYGEENS